jgi:alpha-galactosidase
MTRITFVGAGSLTFTRDLVRDILTFPPLRDATLVLMDIDAERLAFAEHAVRRIVERGQYPARIEATLDRVEALESSDVVLCTVLAHPVGVWRHDLEIPKRFGVDTNIGDTRGPSGVFRALRTIPVMLAIAQDIERYCPGAVLLNYTNPMAMLCRAIQRSSPIALTGLCHSVQGTAAMLARWIGAPSEEVTYSCAGINHQAWYLQYRWQGVDAYPLIRQAVQEPEIYNEEIVRNELFLHLGYYPTESSGHNSEYNWWFRKRPDLIERYCTPGTGWNPGEYAYSLKDALAREASWRSEAQQPSQDLLSLERGEEYAANIINALCGGEPFGFNGNVRNTALITNLPQDACVEVPVYADRSGFRPVHVGALPPQLVALNHVSVMVEEMAVEAALTGDSRLVFQAIAYDPLTAAVLSLAEIRRMVNEMLSQDRDHLPQFKHWAV